MSDFQWVNQRQPQTLYGATILCYIDAVFGVLGGGIFILIAIGLGAGGFGIANERKWGYTLAAVAAVAQLVLLVLAFGFPGVLGFPQIMSLMFDGLLVGLILHPMSREYQRIWFK